MGDNKLSELRSKRKALQDEIEDMKKKANRYKFVVPILEDMHPDMPYNKHVIPDRSNDTLLMRGFSDTINSGHIEIMIINLRHTECEIEELEKS